MVVLATLIARLICPFCCPTNCCVVTDMTPKQFAEYAEQGYNRIPLIREVLADLDTPLSTFLKLAAMPYTYLLESVQGGEKWGRYSIIGLPCKTVVKAYGYRVVVEEHGRQVGEHETEDPLQWITDYLDTFKALPVSHLPRFTGGLVGYFGYDSIRYIETKLGECPNPDTLGLPDILMMVSDEIVVFDNLSGKLYLIIHADPNTPDALQTALERLNGLTRALRTGSLPMPDGKKSKPVTESDFVSSFPQAEYEAAVERIKDYIVAGDVMQVVPSQRMSIPFSGAPLDVYRALRSLNPSPYMYYLDLDDFHIVGSSPEILVHVEDGNLTVRPIAGTRRRGSSEEEDTELEHDLLSDPKELAEHLMLIDLGRNDVGRVARTGSVELTEKMVIERYSHVMHIVSNVTGQLKENMTPIDALRATFPAGTLSGAPKIRAMEIIDEVEPVKRGVYGGAVGYLGWGGTMDTAIAIRTAVIHDETLHIQAGGGVVADSVPQLEWEETLNKGRAMFKAVALAATGLDPEQ